MKLIDVWINCPDEDHARRIAERLVEGRLVACANIYAPIESVYRWQGAVERAREVPLLVKTRAELFEAVAAEARGMHPDETPAIHAVEAAAVTADYLAWAYGETREP
jgi:periplasmic divalent cation tolerance protein